MGNWIANYLANIIIRREGWDVAVDVQAALEKIKPRGEMTELTFRDHAIGKLKTALDGAKLQREAGVPGTSTHVDIFAHVRDHDFLITVKKGLSPQKIKTAKGEIDEFIDHWKPTVRSKRTFVLLYVFGLKDHKELESLNTFEAFVERVNRDYARSFLVDLALSGYARDERRE